MGRKTKLKEAGRLSFCGDGSDVSFTKTGTSQASKPKTEASVTTFPAKNKKNKLKKKDDVQSEKFRSPATSEKFQFPGIGTKFKNEKIVSPSEDKPTNSSQFQIPGKLSKKHHLVKPDTSKVNGNGMISPVQKKKNRKNKKFPVNSEFMLPNQAQISGDSSKVDFKKNVNNVNGGATTSPAKRKNKQKKKTVVASEIPLLNTAQLRDSDSPSPKTTPDLSRVQKRNRRKHLKAQEYSDSENHKQQKKRKRNMSNDSTSMECSPAEMDQLPCLKVSTGFLWDINSVSVSGRDIAADDSSDEDDEENIEQVSSKKRKLTKRESEKEEETFLYKTERSLVDPERLPETVDDYDRLVLGSPNSSLVWIKYIAFHLESAEVEKARAVAERALKTISFREDQEKFNVWVAMMNLENDYGTIQQQRDVFRRATEYNDALKVNLTMANIYLISGKREEAEALFKKMVKRYNKQTDVWIEYGRFLMEGKQVEAARDLMNRCLKSLPAKEHGFVISKFAGLEFTHGDVTKGRSMFDSLLSACPKRSDLWSVYIDALIKQRDFAAARSIFDRILSTQLPAKNLKTFFKKSLDFERRHGTPESVEEVLERTRRFAESLDENALRKIQDIV